jgi:large subunit ribosomal protein L21
MAGLRQIGPMEPHDNSFSQNLVDKSLENYTIYRLRFFLEVPLFAIIQTGGKQYRVSPGDILRVEHLPGERGDEVLLEQVLLVADGEAIQVGQPLVAGARVVSEILRQGKAKKIIVFKKKRRKKYRRKQGHRQLFTALEIKDIVM